MDPKKLTSKAVGSIFKPDHKSYLYRSRVPEYDNLAMLECLQDLENFDGGRTDKEGRENKAREVQVDIQDMGEKVYTMENAFIEGYLPANMQCHDEFTDQHPQDICTDEVSGESMVYYPSDSVPEDIDDQEQIKMLYDANCKGMYLYAHFGLEKFCYRDAILYVDTKAPMQRVLSASEVNQEWYHVLFFPLNCVPCTILYCLFDCFMNEIMNLGQAQVILQALNELDSLGLASLLKETARKYAKKFLKVNGLTKFQEAGYPGQTREVGYQQPDEILKKHKANKGIGKLKDLNGCQHEKVESEGSLFNFEHLPEYDGQRTIRNKIEASEAKFNFYKNVVSVNSIVLEHMNIAVKSAALADTQNALEYHKRYDKARANLSAIRKRPERMECFVLSSRDNDLFEQGSYASSVQKLMKKDLNRIGVGGNGEVVEAFHQKQHLVIKRTLLRELEYSVVPTLDHKNLLPWFALVCGERSENRPGQLTCYQIMPKMTEDLSASIRAIGGSVHDHMLNCLQENIPKADISVRAELLRRNTSLVFRGVLEGLDYLHQQELVHRDIKASNILVKRADACSNSTHTVFTCDCGPQWEVRIADFDSLGQVAVLRERAARRSKRAMSGGRGFIKVSTTGTSGYRAPEIFEEFSSSDTKDPQYFSPASDMWAFGGVAIHTVMGFSCPSKQYQFGIMMLADKGMVNQGMKFTKGESEDLVAKTLGLHHIKEGFPGEKWLDMINFVSRPLKIEPKDRPPAAALLQDPFILHYNPRDTPIRNINSANPPPPNITTAPHSTCINQLQGTSRQLSSTGLVTPYQPQEYSAL